MNSFPSLNDIIGGATMTRPQAAAFMQAVIGEELCPERLSATLAVLRHRGETTPEFMGFLDTLFAHAITVPYSGDLLVDTCGTGGDGLGTFNISTAVAIVLAAQGVPVAKHGNRSVSSRSGSADVLEAAGVPITGDVDVLAAALERRGIAFLFAPYHHPALKVVAPVRRALGVMTVFNLLGPQVNPAPLTHQYVGVPNLDFFGRYADLFLERGLDAYVVHGRSGADEALPGGHFHLAKVGDGRIQERVINPATLGSGEFELAEFRGGDAKENAAVLWALLDGSGPESLQHAIALNAGLALELTGQTTNAAEGFSQSLATLRTGEAAKLLRAYIEELS